ncbi:MAG: alpha/beta hydrolase [Rhodobacteraceae bacterium]|nr:alpha/beta hydrolase [Paracoccaceae bacterium]
MKFTSSDGLHLAYEDEGEGTVLLCLPGLTRNARDFDDLADAISGVRLVRLTYRGRGESDYDPNYANYNVPQEAKDALELLDHLGIEKAIFVGTSRGGIIAMLTAAMAKDRMSGVLLNDIGPEINSDGLSRIMDYLGIQPKVKTFEQAAAGLRANMGAEFPKLTDADWLEQAKRWMEMGPDGIRLNYDPKLRDAILEQATKEQPDLWPLFDAMDGLPLALIRGANSDLLSEESVAEMQRRRPDTIYANVPDKGHVPFLNEPEAVAAIEKLIGQVG